MPGWIYDKQGNKIGWDFGSGPVSVSYRKGEVTLAGMKKELARDASLRRAVEQPFHKDGRVNREFVKQHGADHEAYQSKPN